MQIFDCVASAERRMRVNDLCECAADKTVEGPSVPLKVVGDVTQDSKCEQESRDERGVANISQTCTLIPTWMKH